MTQHCKFEKFRIFKNTYCYKFLVIIVLFIFLVISLERNIVYQKAKIIILKICTSSDIFCVYQQNSEL